MNKTEINSLTEKDQNKIKEMVSHAQSHISKGHITIRKHQIRIKKLPEPSKKRYSIPLAIRDEAQSFIKDLEGKNSLKDALLILSLQPSSLEKAMENYDLLLTIEISINVQ